MFSRFVNTGVKAKTVAGAAAAIGVVSLFAIKMSKKEHKERCLIIGGGTGGLGVAAMLRNEGMKNVTIVEPSSLHYYQPLWTLVGGGVKPVRDSARPLKDIIPKGTNLIQNKVKSFLPESNQVVMEDGTKVDYDYLVVASGMQIDWNKIPGLVDGLEKEDSGVVSIYDYNYADKTWRAFQAVKDKESPNLLFTMSPTAIKCAGAPQKIMWLMEDTLRGLGKRDQASVSFWTPGAGMFGVKYYSDKLEKIRQERGVIGKFMHELIAIDPDNKIATFKNKETNNNVTQKFDLLHVAPHMSAPDFLKKAPISDENGWVDVNKHTLQSTTFPNVFGLGDCTNTPNSKTAAAITAQAPVLVNNILRAIDGKPLDGYYNGYASCPLIIARGRIILAEFGYDGKLMETFARETGPFPLKYFGTDGAVQQRFFYFLKEQLFPFVYWNFWTRGMWYGTSGIFKPSVTKKNADHTTPSTVNK